MKAAGKPQRLDGRGEAEDGSRLARTLTSMQFTPTAGFRAGERSAGTSKYDRLFYSAMAVTFLTTVVAGFRSTFFRTLTGAPTLSPLVYTHFGVMMAWMVVLVVQTTLVAVGRRTAHRRFGLVGILLGAAVLALGYVTAIAAARRGYNPSPFLPDSFAFLATPIGDLAVFAVLVAMAVYHRQDVETHKRLMLLAVLGALLPPALRRLPGQPWSQLVIFVSLLAAGPAYDRWSKGHVDWVYKWVGAIVFLAIPARVIIGNTHAWQEIARMLVR